MRGPRATGRIFLAERTARAAVWRPRTACYGQCQTHVHSFLFLILHCGMKGFVHRKAIPDIKRLIEEVFWDMRREGRPFPKPAEPHWVSSCLQRPRLKTCPELETNPADSQQLLWCQGCTSERENSFAVAAAVLGGRKGLQGGNGQVGRDPKTSFHPTEA